MLLNKPHDKGPFGVSSKMVSGYILVIHYILEANDDTPGIFDKNKPDEVVFEKIARTVQKCAYGIKAILFVFEEKRFTEEQKNALNGIKMFLGEDAMNYMIAIFSHATKRQTENRDVMRNNWNSLVTSFIGNLGYRWGISPNSDYFFPGTTVYNARIREIKDFIISTRGVYSKESFESARRKQEKNRREKEEEEAKAAYEEMIRKEGIEKAEKNYQETLNEIIKAFEQKEKNSLDKLKTELQEQFKKEKQFLPLTIFLHGAGTMIANDISCSQLLMDLAFTPIRLWTKVFPLPIVKKSFIHMCKSWKLPTSFGAKHLVELK
ncbi:hypothetical protein Glove_1033g3 [Diversispora epigaea]|uniref:AIG1-type G domain-containing protein n=1 Tax=Diversispora epigaea TaxID=1348612 RepID=A0A397G1Y0_9GLOM|nr:hypothetical protein Glove_1033g3 [Diversispora epigaea]